MNDSRPSSICSNSVPNSEDSNNNTSHNSSNLYSPPSYTMAPPTNTTASPKLNAAVPSSEYAVNNKTVGLNGWIGMRNKVNGLLGTGNDTAFIAQQISQTVYQGSPPANPTSSTSSPISVPKICPLNSLSHNQNSSQFSTSQPSTSQSQTSPLPITADSHKQQNNNYPSSSKSNSVHPVIVSPTHPISPTTDTHTPASTPTPQSPPATDDQHPKILVKYSKEASPNQSRIALEALLHQDTLTKSLNSQRTMLLRNLNDLTYTMCALSDDIVSHLAGWMKSLPFYVDLSMVQCSDVLSHSWCSMLLFITCLSKAWSLRHSRLVESRSLQAHIKTTWKPNVIPLYNSTK